MSAGPLRQVLAAVDAGALTVAEVATRTGLSTELINACLGQLVRMGMLSSQEVPSGCPTGGCGGCPSAGGSCDSGPVLVGLSRTRH